MLTYNQINQKLFELNFAKKSRMDLESMQTLYQAFDLKEYPKIHIAGTNGKGSCVKKISEALTGSGYKCGSFSSPHISTFRERIQIDGKMISKEEVVKQVPKIFEFADTHNIEVTFFELITLLGLKYFADNNVDVAVIEVGLGGRLDATNCITPILSVITSIGFDHVQILGDTLEKIAFEKAGIIKEKVPVITGPFANQKVIYKIAKEKNSEFIKVEGDFLSYDEENQAISKRALDHLKSHFELKKEAVEKALKEKQPCRLEKGFFLDHEIILDISHNAAGLKRLFFELKNKYPEKKITVFTSMASNHDYKENLKIIKENSNQTYLLDIDHPRLLKVRALSDENVICNISDVSKIIEGLSKEALILFTGSVFIMDSIYKLIGKEIEEDPYMISDGVFKVRELSL